MDDEVTKGKSELEIILFATPGEWELWLEEHYADQKGIWLRFYKKGSGLISVNYDQALDIALCFGWIDGQTKTFDEHSYLQKFTPRRIRSNWSKRNVGIVARLEQEGRLRPSGIREVESAKADGRWDLAYDSPGNMTIPEDFLREISKNKKAKKFFDALNKVNLYSIGYRLQTAKKPEIRQCEIMENCRH